MSILNFCEHSLTHHGNNAVGVIDNAQRVEVIHDALWSQSFENTFNEKEIAILDYSKKLTCDVGNLKKVGVIKLKQAGCDDGEIFEVNQVTAYFNGLGVSLDGD